MMASVNRGGSLIGKIGSYLQIVTKDPRSTAFVPLAEAYRQIGLLDDALEASRLGTRMLPHFSPGFSTMGRILGQMGRIDEAMSAYAKALSIDRQSQSALVGLARLHLIRSERDQARKILIQAKEFHPGDEKISDTLNALDLPRPWAQIQQASYTQATVSIDEITSDEIGEPIPTATLAEIYVRQGLTNEAVKVYQDILKLNPDNDDARQRVMQLREPLLAETVSPESKVASPETPLVSLETKNEPEDQSLMTVLHRWLTAIDQIKANAFNQREANRRGNANV
ncbi:MAG: tetratricopeptide repeat protein [Candidatus Marinimicrobia bacterium]|nr:tetratricopeptide repeat protein [Candidatus Neomarinimicrobiota bacterium]